MRSGKRREDQVTAVRLPVGHEHTGGALVDFADLAQIGKIQPRFDAVGVQVQRDDHDIEIARALAVAEEGALHAVCSRQQGEFGGGDPGATVIVGVQGNDGQIAAGEVAAHPLDLVGVDVGRGVFDRRGQVENDFVFRGRLPDVGDGFADLQGKIKLGAGEAFRRILQLQPRARSGEFRHLVRQQSHGIRSDLFDRGAVHREDVFALRGRGGVVEVEDYILSSGDRFAGAVD